MTTTGRHDGAQRTNGEPATRATDRTVVPLYRPHAVDDGDPEVRSVNADAVDAQQLDFVAAEPTGKTDSTAVLLADEPAKPTTALRVVRGNRLHVNEASHLRLRDRCEPTVTAHYAADPPEHKGSAAGLAESQVRGAGGYERSGVATPPPTSRIVPATRW